MNEVLKVLCLEDSPRDAEITRELLVDAGFNLRIDTASTEKEFVSFLKSRRYDIILSDFKLPGFDAFSALSLSKEICPEVPLICVSGTVGEETAIELLKKGAVDYILKDRLIRLPAAIHRAIEEAKEKEARHQAERALYESEERFRTLYENSTVGIYRTTPDGKILLANPALVKMLGFSSFEDLSIRNLEDTGFEPSYERTHFKDIMRKEGQINGMEAAWKRTDGSTLYVSESARSIKDKNGGILYYDGIVEDITTRKKAEEIKLESEARYESLFNNMLNGYAYCKMLYQGNYAYDFIYLEVNKAFESLTGLKNVKGKRVSEVIPHIRETDNELFEIYSRVALTGKPEVFENYVESLKMWFSISVYSPEKEYFVAVFDVITGRKLAEEKIRDIAKFPSENPDPVLRVDKDGTLLYANDACNKLLTWKLITGSKIPGTLQREIKSVFNTGIKKTIDIEHIKRMFSFNIVPSIDADYCNIYGHDITERILAEEALRESEERFSKSFRTSPISFMIANLEDGRIIEVNDAFTAISGFTREEALASTTINLKIWVHEQDRKQMIDSLHKGKAILHKETMLRAKDGNVAVVLLSAQVIKLANRNCIISSIENITERKHAEQALGESEERFRSMANSIPQLAWVARADGFIYWYNQRWYEYTGTKPEQMEGWGWQIVHDPMVLPKVMEKWTASIASGQLFEMSFPLRGSDGLFRTFLTRVFPMKDSEGRVVQWFGTNTDVETLKQAEEIINKLNEELEQKVIQRTELLEASNRELEAFSYSVSHDLRAPLRSVHGYTKILVEEYENMLDEEGKRICGIISSSATQMGELIDDLLSFSRIGRTSMNPLLLDMQSIVYSVFEETCPASQKSRTKLKTGKLHKAFGDANLLKIVWTNLISNAIKYTSKGENSEISISSSLKDHTIVYSIKDNGVGFDMTYRHKLFGVFQRLHSESEFEGNGVGLAIVQRIILKHGGKVWAEGEVGKGATFFFSLPENGKRQQASGIRQQAHKGPTPDARRQTPR